MSVTPLPFYGDPSVMLSHLIPWRRVTAEDIGSLKSHKDIAGLIALLGHRSTDVQWRAAEALGAMGPLATGALINCLIHHKVSVRLGAIEALGTIRDPSCADALITILNEDPSTEVRWAAAIALGQIPGEKSRLALLDHLSDPDKYIRFGASRSLAGLPQAGKDPAMPALVAFAAQDWDRLRAIGRPAVPVLVNALSDGDRDVRERAVDILGQMRAPELKNACGRALADPDSAVRYKAVLASRKCGVPMTDLPLYMSHRPRTRPNPFAAAVLNLLFVGLGYNYLGKWWGFLIFMSYMTIMVLISLGANPGLPFFTLYPNLYSYPFTAVFAYHGYHMAKKIPDL